MIRFATIGTNKITEEFLKAACPHEKLIYQAVYSREVERAHAIASQYGVKSTFNDIKKMAGCDDIDAVYIASPNSFHFEQAAIMLSNGKHVLCEKSLASNHYEAKRLKQIAEENRVVIMEAMRSAYDPGLQLIRENLSKLGTIRRASFQYCQYSSRYDNFKNGIIENAFNPVYSNGALMDIGVYCVHALVQLFGKPDKVEADALFLENGVDGQGTILASYDGMQAEVIYSKIANSRVPSQIQGEKGTMVVEHIANPYRVTIYYNDGSIEKIADREEASNLQYEIEEWVRCIERAKYKNPHISQSIIALEVMDAARQQTGIVFPADLQEKWRNV